MNIDEMLDKHDSGQAVEGVISEADELDIKKIKKAFKWKTAIIALVTTTVFVLVSVGAILGGVLGSAAAYAKKSIRFDRDYAINQAEIAAIDVITREYPGFIQDLDTLEVTGVHSDLDVRTPLTNSKYYYRVEFETSSGLEIEVHVDSKTGSVEIDDVDID
ncbi:MAG: hypothetical protein PHG90_05275 [Clostridia bacterium]|nr:hypothetical protein [Clostridia bacterium]